MAGDKRATRLGVLALVATMLFGALGVRLWFLQTVEAEPAAAVDEPQPAHGADPARARPDLRRQGPHPRRQRAHAHRGRRLGRRSARRTDRASCSSACRGGSACRSPTWRRATRPTSTAGSGRCRSTEDVARERRDRDPGALRGLPRRVRSQLAWRRVYPYAPLAPPRRSATWARSRPRRPGYYQQPRLRHAQRGERVGRAGVEQSMETTLHGTWGRQVSRSTPPAGSVRVVSDDAAGERQGHPAVDRPRPAAVRRAGAADRSCACKRAFSSPPTRWSTKPDGSHRADGPRHGPGRCTTRPRPASVVIMDNATGRSWRWRATRRSTTAGSGRPSATTSSTRSSTDDGPRRQPDRPRPVGAGQPRHPGPVQPRLGVQAVHRLRGADAGLIGPGDYIRRQGHVQAAQSIADDVCADRASSASSRTRRAPQPARPCEYGSVNVQTRSPCRATRSSTASASSSSSTAATGAAGPRPPVRLRRRHRHRPAVRVRRAHPRRRAEEASWCDDGRARRGRGAKPATRRQRAAWRSARACSRRRPLQLADGYSAIANGGYVLHAAGRAGDPRTPTCPTAPRPARSTCRRHGRRAGVHPERVRADRRCPTTIRDPILARHPRRTSPGAGANGRYHRPPARSCSTTTRATPSRSPARPARRRAQAATRGTTRRCSPPSASTHARPYTVVAYLEKAGLRLAGRGAGGQVHVPRAVRHDASSTRCCCPIRSTSTHGRSPAQLRWPTRLLERHRTQRRPCPSGDRLTSASMAPDVCLLRASPTAASATSGPARPTRAATSTGCCCSRRARSRSSGCFVVYSASRTRIADDPFRVRHPPGDLR